MDFKSNGQLRVLRFSGSEGLLDFYYLRKSYGTITFGKLRALPPEIGKLVRLKRLYLSDNQLSDLPPEIKRLRRLWYIDLAGNPITGEGRAKIRRWLEHTKIDFGRE